MLRFSRSVKDRLIFISSNLRSRFSSWRRFTANLRLATSSSRVTPDTLPAMGRDSREGGLSYTSSLGLSEPALNVLMALRLRAPRGLLRRRSSDITQDKAIQSVILHDVDSSLSASYVTKHPPPTALTQDNNGHMHKAHIVLPSTVFRGTKENS